MNTNRGEFKIYIEIFRPYFEATAAFLLRGLLNTIKF